ncbi:hypothetical protein J4407_02320 [Candidatus Pacearchaeota archaeon]|nr:hypothetical protein [Candidatus Pacearchaeota archaeon]
MGDKIEGHKIDEVTTFNLFKKVMNKLVKGYPLWVYFGIFETYFKENTEKLLKVLNNDGLIEKKFNEKENREEYRLTGRGITLISSTTQLEYAEETHKFNRWIIYLTISLVTIGTTQLILAYLQEPIFSLESFLEAWKILHFLT